MLKKDGYNDHISMKKVVEEARKKNQERANLHSQKRFIDNITKKFNTTMIGSIAEIEKTFGELWGHGEDESRLTRDQREWRKKFNLLRTAILNNGNNQLRAAINEVGEYTMAWQKYHVDFFPVPKNNTGNSNN
jgi:hypothetical protein